jgi:hypothetical protein
MMPDMPFYNVPDILRRNGDIKQSIGEAILDLKYLSEEFADHKVTGEYVINMLSAVVVDLEEAHDDMIVEQENHNDSDQYRMGSWGKGKDE